MQISSDLLGLYEALALHVRFGSKADMARSNSEEKREPVSDIDTAAADSLKVLDPKRPIREADITLTRARYVMSLSGAPSWIERGRISMTFVGGAGGRGGASGCGGDGSTVCFPPSTGG
jgi:hypothetical protein